MANNKVLLGNEVLIDLTDSTVNPNVLLAGYKAYDASGKQIQGAVSVPTELNDLSDVNVTSPTDKQGLVYDAVTDKWVNGDIIDDTTTSATSVWSSSKTNTELAKKANTSSLATVATSGSYADLSDTPTIPTALSQLTDDATHRVVTDTEKSTWNAKTSLALGETSSTAYRGDRGKTAYDHASAKGSKFDSGLYKITTNSEGHVTGATAVAKADITALGIPAQDTTYTSKAAASGGTDVSLVTTGEKYTWNSKANSSDLSTLSTTVTNNNTAQNNKHKVTSKQVATTGWTSTTTAQSGVTLYKKTIALSHVYVTSPIVDIGASGVLPTAAQQQAYDLLQYVTINGTTLTLYGSAIPTTAYYINITGAD